MIACDTSVMSLALRRRRQNLDPVEKRIVLAVRELITVGELLLLEPVLQELLSGISRESDFDRLRTHLQHLAVATINTEDFEHAASCFNRCAEQGVAGSANDMLICAIAMRCDAPIFTTDRDFERYAQVLPIVAADVDVIETMINWLRA